MKTKIILRILFGLAALCRLQVAWADDAGSTKKLIQELCRSQAEGIYRETFLTGQAAEEFLVEIICVGESKIRATIYNKQNRAFGTMVYLSIEGPNVVFLTYDPAEEGSEDAGGLPMPELSVDIARLKQGELNGRLFMGRLMRPWGVVMKKSDSPLDRFPRVTGLGNPKRNFTMVPGRYQIDPPSKQAPTTVERTPPGRRPITRAPAKNPAKPSATNLPEPTSDLWQPIAMPALVTIFIRGGVQRIILRDQNDARVLLNGLPTSQELNYYDAFAASSGVDNTLNGKAITNHVRGHLINDDQIELWLINSIIGIAGPYTATRAKDGSRVLPTAD
jgi:hypothetical protein